MARKALILLVIVLMLSLTAMACSVSSDGEKTAVMSEPSTAPSAEPTEALTEKPSEAPTEKPTATPSEVPTAVPTEKPTETPTKKPTEKPTSVPVYTPEPTEAAYVVRCTDQNGNPVSGLTVTIGGQSCTTDEKGEVVFRIIFDETNYNQPTELTISKQSQTLYQEDIDFFTTTPIQITIQE